MSEDKAELKLMLELLLRDREELKARVAELEEKLADIELSNEQPMSLSNMADSRSTEVLSSKVLGTNFDKDINLSDKTRSDVDKAIDYIFQYCEQRQGQHDLSPRQGWRERK